MYELLYYLQKWCGLDTVYYCSLCYIGENWNTRSMSDLFKVLVSLLSGRAGFTVSTWAVEPELLATAVIDTSHDTVITDSVTTVLKSKIIVIKVRKEDYKTV